MGIIQRQSIKQSLVHYFATGIGALSTIFIYPQNGEIYGLAIFIISAATLLAPFLSLGINSLTIRFFPTFRNESNQHHGFLGLLLLGALCCIIITSIIIFILQGPFYELIEWLQFDVSLFMTYDIVIWVLCLLLVFSNILNAYTSNFHRIVIPHLFTNLLPKLSLPILVLLFAWDHLHTNEFTLGIVLTYLLIVLGQAVYLGSLGQFKLRIKSKIINRKLIGSMREYALFGLLGSLGSILATRIDTIMVPALLNLTSTGIYGISMFIGNSIEIPSQAIIKISSPLIAQAWQKGDMEEIKLIYRKGSVNLFLAGLLVFMAVWISLDDLFRLTSNYEGLTEGVYVVLFIGLAKLVDMLTSVNSQIIGYSKYFRFNLYAVLFLGVVNIYLNYLLIPKMGITGAAVATFFSISMFNVLKVFFIWNKFRMHPFSLGILKLLIIAPFCFLMVDLIPNFQIPVLNLFKNSVCISILYVGLVVIFSVSEDFNKLLFDIFYRLKLRKP